MSNNTIPRASTRCVYCNKPVNKNNYNYYTEQTAKRTLFRYFHSACEFMRKDVQGV